MTDLKEGYIIDYISSEQVKATPEELEAVQVFSRILVEDYGYPKEVIQTRPQFRVKSRPSDTTKPYPLDIAVFNNINKNDDNIWIIIECKKKNRKDGRGQLENYLTFSKAQLGVWFNGEEKLFLKKLEKDGKVLFEEIPNIPIYGQRIEDIGKFKRKDLKPAYNLKSIFRTMRNYLAGNVVGATRDEVLAQQLINVIFCKIYDEKYTRPDDIINFRAGVDEKPEEIKTRILDIFDLVKKKYQDVMDSSDKIMLDAKSLSYVVGELQLFSLTDAERDAVGDAFEVFIDHALKGGQGQFFTPRNVVKMTIDILDPSTEDLIIDPACGSGGFIIECLRHLWSKVEEEGIKYKWPQNEIEIEKQKVAIDKIRGIDKDYFLGKVCKAYMAILGDGRGGIFCENSLDVPANWSTKTREKIQLGTFSIVVTNPPFGKKINVEGEKLLSQYDIGYKWKNNKKDGVWEKGKIKDKEAPQYLFIERCIHLLKPGGKMGIVLPDGIFGNDQLGYIRNIISDNCQIVAVVDVPKETFMPHTSTKTSILFVKKLEKKSAKDYPVFMAVAEKCGHDRRGNTLEEEDLSGIAPIFRNWLKENNVTF
ncbi:restriction endonuclease subunit M [Flavobacterium psychraquaticum]|uniref:restriction endonuclease subunit M n=1 Tax=Flavobacterium psychraquaticum TaxID=3103958 RepID=UPI002ACE6E80|nr:N-6 DNA methylase [Flavobacterium sp. LB-N7T]